MSADLIAYGVVALLLAVGLDRLRQLGWRPRDPADRASSLNFLIVAIIFALLAPSTYARVDRWLGIPNVAQVLGNCLSVLACWVYQPCLDQAAGTPPRKRGLASNVWLMAGTIGALAALFAAMVRAGAQETAPLAFVEGYGTAALMLAYTCTLSAYTELTACRLLHLSWRFDHSLPRPHRSARVRLQTMGWVVAVIYGLHDPLRALLRALGLTYPPPGPTVVIEITIACGALLLMSGGFFDLHDWGRCWGTRYRAYRQLHPLWRDLARAVPKIIERSSFRPRWSALDDALAVNDIGLRLLHRTIAIRDATVALRPHIDPAAVDLADTLCREAGLVGKEAEIVIRATRLGSAIQASARLDTTAAPTPPTPASEHGGDDLAAEVDYLRRVAWAYRHSPIVAAALGWVAQRPAGRWPAGQP